jgi:hypothetical protein
MVRKKQVRKTIGKRVPATPLPEDVRKIVEDAKAAHEARKKPAPGEDFNQIAAHELEHQIRLRAYELYEARGREDGHDLDDWLQAEAELTEKQARPAA